MISTCLYKLQKPQVMYTGDVLHVQSVQYFYVNAKIRKKIQVLFVTRAIFQI